MKFQNVSTITPPPLNFRVVSLQNCLSQHHFHQLNGYFVDVLVFFVMDQSSFYWMEYTSDPNKIYVSHLNFENWKWNTDFILKCFDFETKPFCSHFLSRLEILQDSGTVNLYMTLLHCVVYSTCIYTMTILCSVHYMNTRQDNIM